MDGVTDLVELAKTFPAVVPARAGTHDHGLWNMFIALDAHGRRPEK
jgi:hypothetical protein